VLRAVRFQDLTDDEALAEIVRRLRDLGVDRLLNRAGAKDGDVVNIGPLPSMVARRRGRGLDRAITIERRSASDWRATVGSISRGYDDA